MVSAIEMYRDSMAQLIEYSMHCLIKTMESTYMTEQEFFEEGEVYGRIYNCIRSREATLNHLDTIGRAAFAEHYHYFNETIYQFSQYYRHRC